ncbi:MAG: SAM-dependent methyltransferase [Terriglobia bacterium]
MSLTEDQYRRYANLTFDDMRRMAKDESLSQYEKIGFPDSYRKGKEELIFQSILSNLPLLNDSGKVVLDVGPGCSGLPHMMIDLCRHRGHKLLLVDSEEMLAHLPNDDFIQKFPAYYPQCDALFEAYSSKVDVLLTYSVLHLVFVEGNLWDFLDRSLELLAEGAQMMIGDIPNISKRRRFFSSSNGVKFHQQVMNTQSRPELNFNRLDRRQIDDSVILAMISRARNQGFDAYLLPQPPGLPLENRREDVLIRRP